MKMYNSEPSETIELENNTLEIYVDEYPTDPREWDNLGIMAFFHSRYNLGDNPFSEPEDLHEFMNENDCIYLPVFMYDHSGIGLSTNNSQYPFNCPWDSGMLGYIYVTYEQVRKEFGWKNLTQKRIQKIRSHLQNELEVYNCYVSGRAYGYHLICNDCKSELDTCWGFYGEDWKGNGLLDYAEDFTCQCQTAKVFQNAGVGL